MGFLDGGFSVAAPPLSGLPPNGYYTRFDQNVHVAKIRSASGSGLGIPVFFYPISFCCSANSYFVSLWPVACSQFRSLLSAHRITAFSRRLRAGTAAATETGIYDNMTTRGHQRYLQHYKHSNDTNWHRGSSHSWDKYGLPAKVGLGANFLIGKLVLVGKPVPQEPLARTCTITERHVGN